MLRRATSPRRKVGQVENLSHDTMPVAIETDEPKKSAAADSPAAEKSDAPAAAEKGEFQKTVAEAAVATEETALRQAFYCLTDNLLVITDDLGVMKGILARRHGKSDDSLADVKPFQIVMQRCASDYGKAQPQMRWFLSPLGYAEAARASTPAAHRRKGKSILEVMRHQGVGAIQGVGGVADFSTEGFELVHRTAIYAARSVREIDENAGPAQPVRFHAGGLGAARRGHVHHLVFRHSQRFRPLRTVVQRVVRPGGEGRLGPDFG